ncbi:hypothetical protein EVAR_42549_1 [Eumeta japonica]|uniref:Uncharacterized protein n=1 Tax=Eumeta variegata TaxID=151549 RepID=A0A4C1WRC8_EUMVA|nr:hypothetical protein EVAR_42549_1 [Eumeta japonica]
MKERVKEITLREKTYTTQGKCVGSGRESEFVGDEMEIKHRGVKKDARDVYNKHGEVESENNSGIETIALKRHDENGNPVSAPVDKLITLFRRFHNSNYRKIENISSAKIVYNWRAARRSEGVLNLYV